MGVKVGMILTIYQVKRLKANHSPVLVSASLVRLNWRERLNRVPTAKRETGLRFNVT